MAGALATTIVLNPNCSSINSPKNLSKCKPTRKPTSNISLSLQNLHRNPTTWESCRKPETSSSLMAGAIFSTLAYSDPALAAKQLADASEGDNRGLALLLPITAILWVLYNILGPALNQINRMRNEKGIVIGLGLGGFTASSLFTVPSATASEMAMLGEASSDSRGLLLLAIVAPALLWVLYNILQPALNQVNRMRSGYGSKHQILPSHVHIW